MPDRPFDPFVRSSTYPTREGNAVRLLVDGLPALERLCQAIDAASHRVWATITFMWPEFVMPGGRGTALDVLARAAQRGVDVRLVFWRPDDATAHHRRNAFWGAPEHIARLEASGAPIAVRWDRAQPGYCQHQKTWLIDAGDDDQLAFVGGINLNPHAVVAPGHDGRGHHHDAYLELAGPCVADVHHNFVQRWNEASERHAQDGVWGEGAHVELPFPSGLPPRRGTIDVQIQRTMHPGRYRRGRAPVGGRAFAASSGERTIFDQALRAIRAARHSLYLENQYLEVREIVDALGAALERGVEVVLVMPAVPDVAPTAHAAPERRALFEAWAALERYPTFTLSGLAGLDALGQRAPVYVHSKLMLVDDAWATIGSANLHHYSLFGNSELNAAVSSPELVRGFRVTLLAEHLGTDTSGIDDVAALRTFRRIATENRQRLAVADAAWQGLAFRLDASDYGRSPRIP